ncbi:MAG: restriction endonuclease subunit S [Bacteroidia bacterium]
MELVPLHKLFKVKYGVNLELVHVEQCAKEHPDSINFVSRTESNNGVSAFVLKTDEHKPNPKHTISVAGSGSVLSSFYQEEEYYSGRDLYYLSPINNLSKLEMLFYAYCLTKNKYKYNYGRQANKTLKDILVPAKIPKEFEKLNIEKLNTLNSKNAINTSIKLECKKWSWFELSDTRLFKITGSKTTPILELEEYGKGLFPFVTTQATKNGIEDFFNFSTEKGNVLTVDSAVIGYCSYQPLDFSASDHVEKLMPSFEMNKYSALFIATIINREQYRYNYGRKASQTRLKIARIKLPSRNNNPDFEFMENYIKSLPYSASL